MRDDQLIFEIFKVRPRARWPGINDIIPVEDDIQVDGSWPISERRDPSYVGFNPLEHLEECNRWEIRLDLKQKRGKRSSFYGRMNGGTYYTGTIYKTGLVGYVHGRGLIQEACVDYCDFRLLLIDIITGG